MKSNKNKTIAKIIRTAFFLAFWITLWQVVRLFQGHIGAPGFDQIQVIAHSTGQIIFGNSTDTTLSPVAAGILRVIYYLWGLFVWTVLAVLVWNFGDAVARMVEVGFKQYMTERKEAKREIFGVWGVIEQ
jgi:hypothetical protein